MKLLKWIIVVSIVVGAAGGTGFWMRPVEFFNGLMYARAFLSGVESRELMVDGYRMHYNVAGRKDAPAVVLVHGLGGRAEDWRNLAPYLVRAGYRVYMPDLIGYGRSQRPADYPYSVPGEAQTVVDFMNALGLQQVELGGWSMGGWIVQGVAFDHPERVRRLILFDSAGIYEAPRWDTRLFTPKSTAEVDRLDELLMPNPPKVPEFIASDILRISASNAWIIHRAMASMLAGKDATDGALRGLKMPVLIVWGEVDHITPLSQGEKIHQLVPQSQLEVIPGCGHLAPVQCAAQIGPTVVQFLGK